MSENLIEVRDLKVSFDLPEGQIEAVKGVSFRVQAGKTVSLVGESGSGKSVVSQSIMGILPKSAHITGGQILSTWLMTIDALLANAARAFA